MEMAEGFWQPLRHEDLRLVTGRGQFIADLPASDALEAAILRSPLAHAEIVRIDTTAALRLPGVRSVLAGNDMGAALLE